MNYGLTDQTLANLSKQLGHVGLDSEEGMEDEYDNNDGFDIDDGYGYNSCDEDDGMFHILDPFSSDDTKYRFDIDSVAMGNMDGKQLQFYEGLSYPTDPRGSFIRFDQSRMEFVFFVKALPYNERPRLPCSGTFPYSKAPSHAQDIRAAVELTDIQSKGIGCVREVNGTTIWVEANRNTPPRQSYGSAQRTPILTRKVVLTMSLRRPPRFRVPITNITGNPIRFSQNDEKEITHRQGTSRDFVDASRRTLEATAGPASIWAEQDTFKVGQYLAYRFEMYVTDAKYRILESLLQKLRMYSVDANGRLPRTLPQHLKNPGASGTLNQGLDVITHRSEAAQRRYLQSIPMPTKTRQEHSTGDASAAKGWQPLEGMTFSIRWLIEGLISHGIILPFEANQLVNALEKAFPTRLSGRKEPYEQKVWQSLQERVLCSIYNEERIKDIDAYVRNKAKYIRRAKRTQEPAHTILIRRVTVTPTRVLLFPPERETSNSVLRKYVDHDSFLRVTFADENDRLRVDPATRQSDAVNSASGLLGRVRRVLAHGLDLAGRHFDFLASSSSQMREHGCWLVSNIDPGSIYDWMGVINETIVAKYASRMGIPFSTTREVTGRPLLRLLPADDVKVGKYTFTDGAGRCSQSLAVAAARVLGYKGANIQARPSAIQVRIGGAKGILVVSDALPEWRYQLRDSMIKFNTNRTEFCAIRIASFSKATLNRQYVALFSAHGISDSIFIEMFQHEVKHIRGLPLRFKANAYDRNRDLKLVGSISSFPVKALVSAGFGKDPCVQEVLRVLEVRILHDLKWRNRLPIPLGVFLMGVPDEYGVLNEGEIFCQWQDPEDRLETPQVVQGHVMICRAPAMHMGDIRRVKAVDQPRLRHLVNVIVFSVKGKRDLPNMLGGGDLDGDDYTLIWDKRFLIRENSPPMDYTPPEPVRVKQVTMVHVRENFVNYLKNDMLGQIANAHLAWTDSSDPSSDMCTELAWLHSVAVDFAKTGVPADMPLDLRPRRWPDFMDKPPKYTYRSEKILGQLFRIVDPEPTFKETRQEDIAKSLDTILSKVSVPYELLELVARTKIAYDIEMWGLCLRYRLAEAEAFCGIVLRNAKRHKPKDHDLKEPVTQAFSLIVEEARQEILSEYAVLNDPEHTFEVPAVGKKLTARNMIAIACYQVAYLDKYRHLTDDAADDRYDDGAESLSQIGYQSGSKRRLISFAWLFWEDIVNIPAVKARERRLQ